MLKLKKRRPSACRTATCKEVLVSTMGIKIKGTSYGNETLLDHIGERVLVWFEDGALLGMTKQGLRLGILTRYQGEGR